jgi:N-acetylmuramoyl-L-alanine amidase
MTRRTPAEFNWDALEFDETILDRHFTSPRELDIQFVVVHHMTVLGSGTGGALDACYNIWQDREASAHYGVDGALVRQFVWDAGAAWATANYVGNHAGISIEHANSTTGDASGWKVSTLTWNTGARLAAYIHVLYELGRPTSNGNGSSGTLRTHQSFYSTACPGPFLMSIWGQYVAEAQRVYDEITGTGSPTPPIAPAPAAKSIGELADEVLQGKHGNGDQRRASLGGNYDAVQAEINRRAGISTPVTQPVVDITAIAEAVIRGEYGSGDDRRNRLGGLYDQVQAEVNRLLGGGHAAPGPSPDIGELADAVIRGEFGSGDDRRANLGALYDEVQAEVNRKLGSPTPSVGPSLTQIAQQVIAGQWGNGDDRINRLQNAGYNYNAVQAEVNALLQ